MTPALDSNLWTRLAAFDLDEPSVDFSFSQRLAQENGWPRQQAIRVIEEYKRFLYLCARSGHLCTPSDAVDQVWHLHLCYTRSYWVDLCANILEKPLHHGPTRGGPTEADKFHDWYEKTLESYRHHFGSEPPADIWQPAQIRFSRKARFRRLDVSRHWILRKPSLAAMAGLIGLPLSLAMIGCGAILADDPYMPIYVFVGVGVLAIGSIIFRLLKGGGSGRGGKRGGGSCGDSGCGNDGGSGCGGGGGCGGD